MNSIQSSYMFLNSLIRTLILCQFGCNYFLTSFEKNKLDSIFENYNESRSGIALVADHIAQHKQFPECSLTAINHAIENDAEIIELDEISTKDVRLVLLHYSKIDRITKELG